MKNKTNEVGFLLLVVVDHNTHTHTHSKNCGEVNVFNSYVHVTTMHMKTICKAIQKFGCV